MEQTISPTQVREVVALLFRQNGADIAEDSYLEERVRIEDGRRIAHTYRTGQLFAMWMVEIGLLQFYDSQGNMLQTLNLFLASPQERKAA